MNALERGYLTAATVAVVTIALLVATFVWPHRSTPSTERADAHQAAATYGDMAKAAIAKATVLGDRETTDSLRSHEDSARTAGMLQRYKVARENVPPMPAITADTTDHEGLLIENQQLRNVVLAQARALAKADSTIAAIETENAGLRDGQVTLRLRLAEYGKAESARELQIKQLNNETAAAVAEGRGRYMSGMKLGLTVGGMVGLIIGAAAASQ